MDLYVILRRGGWRTAEDLQEAAARSAAEGDRMPDDVRWIRSYVTCGAGRFGRDGLHLPGEQPRGDPRARAAPPTCPSTRSSRWPTP